MSRTRPAGAAALVLALALAVGGCSSDDGSGGPGPSPDPSQRTASEPDPSIGPAADDAAATYLVDLKRYRGQVARAARLAAAWQEGDSVAEWQAAERAFVTALDRAPSLEAVDGGTDASESYARVSEIAARTQGFVDEHEWMTRWDIAENVRVNGVLYDISSEQYDDYQRLATAYETAMARPGDSKTKMQKALATQIPAQLESLARARRKVEAMAGKDSFTPSLRDLLLNEIDTVAALGERYLAYVEAVPAQVIDRDFFRNGFSSGLAVPGGAVSNAPADRMVAARKLLADGLSGLLAAADGAGGEQAEDLPLAGDIYRELIDRVFVPHSRGEDDARRLAVDEQLYWLWRIREIEDTPDDAFDNARLTIKLQLQGPEGLAQVNVDSRFDELAAISTAMAVVIGDGPESMSANKPWIVELLDRPFPDALADPVALTREAAALLSEDGSPESPELASIGPLLLKAMKKAANGLDSKVQFRRDFRAAIAGTRPLASPAE